MTLPEYVKLLAKHTKAKKAAEAKAEAAGSLIHQIATIHIPPLMEKLETDEFNSPGVGRIELRQEVYASVLKADIPAFYEALRKKGDGALIVEYIFPGTLKSYAKEQLEANAALPPQLKATFIPTAKLLKARNK